MVDAGSGANDFRSGMRALPRGRQRRDSALPWLLMPLLCAAQSAALAQAPPPPPPQIAEVIEVRIVSKGGDGSEVGRGWAVEQKTRSGTGCQVLTPWHVVSDRADNHNEPGETRVYGVDDNVVGMTAVMIGRVDTTLDLARVTLDSNRGCPFGPANKGRLPEQGLVLWWLNERGGVNRLDGDARSVVDDDQTGAIANAPLREAGRVEAGMSGATVFFDGQRAGMLIATPGRTDRFSFLTARGIQQALGSDLAVFDLGAADAKPTAATPPKATPPAFPFVDARSALANVEAPVVRDDAQLRNFALFKDCPDCPAMAVIPDGGFMMGSPHTEQERFDEEGPQHRVALKRFALARTEVTVAEFRRFVEASGYRTDAEKNAAEATGCFAFLDGSDFGWKAGTSWRDPGFRQEDNHPVACISWNDAKAYVGWLGKQTGEQYRLPSEAEFEYALRAGGDSVWPWGDGVGAACTHGNVADRQAKQKFPSWSVVDCDDRAVFTAPVGRYGANGYGVYDLTGNAWEWVQDCWNPDYKKAPPDGKAWMTGDCGRAVLRGGSWDVNGWILRSAYRYGYTRGYRLNYTGFRPARSVAL